MYADTPVPPPRLSDPAIYESQPEFLKQSINRERYFWGYDTREKYEANMRAYFRMITGLDREIGRVIAALEAHGLAENTIVVYSADNGYYMGDRGFQGKWSHYEQSLRVPLIIYDPRVPKEMRGRVVPEMVLNVDLPATFLDWAGLGRPESYQGRSLAGLVRGDALPDWRREFFCEHLDLSPTLVWEGLRGERWMYARYVHQTPVFEFLHDLRADPDELKNLVTDPASKAQLEKMRQRCDELRAGYGPPIPAPVPGRATGRKARE
jgi:arylsulfatase A-like enzyme